MRSRKQLRSPWLSESEGDFYEFVELNNKGLLGDAEKNAHIDLCRDIIDGKILLTLDHIKNAGCDRWRERLVEASIHALISRMGDTNG